VLDLVCVCVSSGLVNGSLVTGYMLKLLACKGTNSQTRIALLCSESF